MEIQLKLAIAIQLLRMGVDMQTLQVCDQGKLREIAKRCRVSEVDLAAFADEFTERTSWQNIQALRSVARRLQTTVLFTDDEACLTGTMKDHTVAFGDLSSKRYYLNGYNAIFRIRNTGTAKMFSEALGMTVNSSAEKLPPMKEGDLVILAHVHKDKLLVTEQLYCI